MVDTLPRLAPSAIDAVERTLGFSLPPSLRDHLLAHHGGRPARKHLIIDRPDGDVVTLGFRHFYAVRDPTTGRELEDSYRLFVVERHAVDGDYLPFGADGGDNPFCIDRKTDAIYFCALDGSEPEPVRGVLVARSLTEFVEGMMTEAEAENDPRWLAALEKAMSRPLPKAKRSPKKKVQVASSVAELPVVSKVPGAKKKSAKSRARRAGARRRPQT